MPDGIRFKNEREFMRALKDLDAQAAKDLQKAAREAAKPVAQEVARLAALHGWSQATVSGIRAGSQHGIGIVRQQRRKTTGTQPRFGGLQMREAFLPALDARTPEVIHQMEAALDRAISRFNDG
jgi:hypothetical protein